jgi:glycosyl transferase family 25
MNILAINLASQAARWRATQCRFEAIGLVAERLEAVDGAHVDAATIGYDPALNRRQHHMPLRPGEIGCYASHLAAWRRLLASGARALAVFEDDVEVDPALPALLRAIERLAVPWDMIKLYGRERERVAWRRALGATFELIGYQRAPSHTCAYVVSRRGAQKLLATRSRFGRPIDVDLRRWWENDLALFGVQPYPVRRAAESRLSTIDDGRRGCTSVAMRLRKIGLQAQYALANALHAAFGGPHDGARTAAQALPRRQPTPGDAA